MVESELAANTYLCKIDPQLLLSSLPPVICTQKTFNSTHMRKTWNQPAPKNVQDVQVWIESCRWQCRIDPKFDQFTSHSATDCQSSGQTCIKKGWAKNPFQGVKYINIARNCETALSSARNSMYSMYSRSVLSGVSWYVLTWPGLPWSNPVCPGLSWWSGKTTDPEGYMSRSWSYIFGRL